MSIFIPGNVPSSKNSKTWTGRFLVESKTSQKYRKATKDYFLLYKNKFKRMCHGLPPYHIGLYFVRDSKRRFDYINACQILADLMVTNGWLEDDNADFFVPVFLGYETNKLKAGVFITKVNSPRKYVLMEDYSMLLPEKKPN